MYLRSRPEFLISLRWIRTRKLDLGKSEKQEEVFRLFEDVDIVPMRNCSADEKRRMSYWILFLLINTLIRAGGEPKPADADTGIFTNTAENYEIHSLYRFVTLGLRGFKQC